MNKIIKNLLLLALSLLVPACSTTTMESIVMPSGEIKVKLYNDEHLGSRYITLLPDGKSFMAKYHDRKDYDRKIKYIQINDKLYGPYYDVKCEMFSEKGDLYSFQYNIKRKPSSGFTRFFAPLFRHSHNPQAQRTKDFHDLVFTSFVMINEEAYCFNRFSLNSNRKKNPQCASVALHDGKINYFIKDKNESYKLYGPFIANCFRYTSQVDKSALKQILKRYTVKKSDFMNSSFEPPIIVASNEEGKQVALHFKKKKKYMRLNKYEEYLKIKNKLYGPFTSVRCAAIYSSPDQFIFGYGNIVVVSKEDTVNGYYVNNYVNYNNTIYYLGRYSHNGSAQVLKTKDGEFIGFSYKDSLSYDGDEFKIFENKLHHSWTMYNNLYIFMKNKKYGPFIEGKIRITDENKIIVAYQKQDGYLYIKELH